MKKILSLAILFTSCYWLNAQNLNLVSTSEIENVVKKHQKVYVPKKTSSTATKTSISNKAKTGELIVVNDKFTGYAIQIFSGNKTEAFKARNRFVQLYPSVTTKIRHSLPDYKVIVGEYIYKKGANSLKSKLRKQFPASIVITNLIVVNERNKTKLLKQVQ